MEINLLNPNQGDLIEKWAHVIGATKHIDTWTTPLELSWLAEYATTITNYLEIGSYRGRSAKVMLMANPTLTMTSLDTWDDFGTFEDYQHNLGPEIAAGRVAFHRGPSQETIEHVHQEFSGSFIDGGHLEHLVIADIEGVMPLMKAGSLLSGHDFRREGDGYNDVARAVRSMFPETVATCESIWTHQL